MKGEEENHLALLNCFLFVEILFVCFVYKRVFLIILNNNNNIKNLFGKKSVKLTCLCIAF